MERDTLNQVDKFLCDMAARYIPGCRQGDDVFELHIRDAGRTYRLRITPDACELNAPDGRPCAARVETTSDAFMRIMQGRLNIMAALMRRMVKVSGNAALLKELPRCFDFDA